MFRKAISFALVGFVNLFVDLGVFFVAYSFLQTAEGVRAMQWLSSTCGCGAPGTVTLVVANVLGWMFAVTSSYVMNSFFTFAAESGRQLSWRAYFTFVASSVLGAIANTTTLVVAADHMPVWAAKGLATLVGFVVNFSMSNFVVFRARKPAPDAARGPGRPSS